MKYVTSLCSLTWWDLLRSWFTCFRFSNAFRIFFLTSLPLPRMQPRYWGKLQFWKRKSINWHQIEILYSLTTSKLVQLKYCLPLKFLAQMCPILLLYQTWGRQWIHEHIDQWSLWRGISNALLDWYRSPLLQNDLTDLRLLLHFFFFFFFFQMIGGCQLHNCRWWERDRYVHAVWNWRWYLSHRTKVRYQSVLTYSLWNVWMNSVLIRNCSFDYYAFSHSRVASILDGKGAGKKGKFQGKANKLQKRTEAESAIREFLSSKAWRAT